MYNSTKNFQDKRQDVTICVREVKRQGKYPAEETVKSTPDFKNDKNQKRKIWQNPQLFREFPDMDPGQSYRTAVIAVSEGTAKGAAAKTVACNLAGGGI